MLGLCTELCAMKTSVQRLNCRLSVKNLPHNFKITFPLRSAQIGLDLHLVYGGKVEHIDDTSKTLSSNSRSGVSFSAGFKWLCFLSRSGSEVNSLQLKTWGQVILMTEKYLSLMNANNERLIL